MKNLDYHAAVHLLLEGGREASAVAAERWPDFGVTFTYDPMIVSFVPRFSGEPPEDVSLLEDEGFFEGWFSGYFAAMKLAKDFIKENA